MTQADPVYIFAGYMRSITTGSTLAAEAGGMRCHYTGGRGRRMAEAWDRPGYSLNYGRIHELEPCRRCRITGGAAKVFGHGDPLPDCGSVGCWTMFENHPERYRGSLVKFIIKDCDEWPWEQDCFDVVFLTRDWNEISQSYYKAFGMLPKQMDSHVKYEALIDRAYDACKGRKQRVHARDLACDDFDQRVASWEALGWPLDPVAAANAIEPEKVRFRAERLPVGMFDTHVQIRDVS